MVGLDFTKQVADKLCVRRCVVQLFAAVVTFPVRLGGCLLPAVVDDKKTDHIRGQATVGLLRPDIPSGVLQACTTVH